MTAGYSGTPQARKLGLKAGQRVTLDEPPPGWQLREPPDGLLAPGADGAADLIIAFFRAEIELADRLPALARRIFPGGALWAAWPRRAGGHESDITDNVVRRHALGLGLVDVKVAAIDEDWSGVRLVWRVSNRLPGTSRRKFRTPYACGSFVIMVSLGGRNDREKSFAVGVGSGCSPFVESGERVPHTGTARRGRHA